MDRIRLKDVLRVFRSGGSRGSLPDVSPDVRLNIPGHFGSGGLLSLGLLGRQTQDESGEKSQCVPVDILSEPINGILTVPEGVFLPDAVVYFCIGTELVLIDMCTPIGDKLWEAAQT